MPAPEISAYSQAVDSGRYTRTSGLRGKYDNVRTRWEDETTRAFLRPHLEPLVASRLREGGGVRLLDIGCGSGDGFEMLMEMRRSDGRLGEHAVTLIPPDRLERYQGIDINESLLVQAKQRFANERAAHFDQGDIRDGLPLPPGHPAYDIYYLSFGTLSHLHDDESARLLAEIAHHAADGSLVLCDWLGRHAYEWRELWSDDLSSEQWMDYRISYLNAPGEQSAHEIESFPLRLMCATEVRRLLARVETEAGIQFAERALFDRSLFVGRHMNTGDYNPDAVPLRARVNELHEAYHRTNLETLRFEYRPREEFDRPNEILRELQTAWNALVRFTEQALQAAASGKGMPEADAAHPAGASHRDELARAMRRMRAVVEASRTLDFDDARANLIEPQLGYALRDLERSLQAGEGHAHGLVGIYEIHKE
jgi:SAM-dependent methyltransferase